MIHTEENEGFDIGEFFHALIDAFCHGVLAVLVSYFLLGINPLEENEPTTKPNLPQLNDCRPNTIKVQPLCGSIGSVKIKSIETDKLNFPMYSDLLEGKPKNWGTKK